MAEKSGFFNAQQTGGSYDRTYSADDFANIFRQMISNGIHVTDEEFEQGVINKNTVNGLKPVRRGSYIDISPGRAMINGYWYENDETLTLQFPNLGGRTLIVLQLSVSNREVKIVSKTWDGGDIVLTQDEGVYEIAIATATHTTSTTYSLTDRREEFITLSLKSIQNLVDSTVDKFYPVGSVYISVNDTNPSTSFGGTWERFAAGRTLVGVDTGQTEFNTVRKEGGEKTHVLTINEMPSHGHEISNKSGFRYFVRSGVSATGPLKIGNVSQGSSTVRMVDDVDTTILYTGGSQAHNNLQPYITVYFWLRTA